MDHSRVNRFRAWYTYPTRAIVEIPNEESVEVIAEDDVIELFKEDLPEIVAGKLREILPLQDLLVRKRNISLEALKNIEKEEGQTDEGFEATKYMGALLAEIDFREYYVLKKWLKYWLRLLEKSGTNISNAEKFNSSDFTQDEILRAKDYPIEDMYEGKLRQMGTRFVGTCPFHKEKTPSFTIFSNENTFYCFGCSAHGDAIDFYSKIHEMDFPKAVRALLQ